MPSRARDVAQIRLDNTMLLFDEFVRATVKHPDAATLRGLERRFAERLQIQPSYWSQIKARSRQIGERLARQFEILCHKPGGWMDRPHDAPDWPAADGADPDADPSPRGNGDDAAHHQPQDDDERFIVGLVLTYYRRHPQRARTRLLELLGEVLIPAPEPPRPLPPVAPPVRPGRAPVADDPDTLWTRTQSGVAPLKRKR